MSPTASDPHYPLIDVENLKSVVDYLVAKRVQHACFDPDGMLREIRFRDDDAAPVTQPATTLSTESDEALLFAASEG